MYDFLATKCKIYLPKYGQVTIWHLRDLIAGRTLRIPAEKAQHLRVPHYEHLTIEKMMIFAAECNDGVALKYLPKDKLDFDRLPRQYVANVIFTLCGEEFDKWVTKTIETRNDNIVKQRDLAIEMDPTIAAIFKQSTSVSSK